MGAALSMARHAVRCKPIDSSNIRLNTFCRGKHQGGGFLAPALGYQGRDTYTCIVGQHVLFHPSSDSFIVVPYCTIYYTSGLCLSSEEQHIQGSPLL